MFKVVLWDYAGIGKQWCSQFLKTDGVQIVRTLLPDDVDQAEVIMRGDWNFILIFEGSERAVFDEILDTMRAMNISTDNIIFANGARDWLKNPAATYALINQSAIKKLEPYMTFTNHSKNHRYVAATTEGLQYISYSSDNFIIREIYTQDKNYAVDEMKMFHALTKKFYGLDDGEGYFLDLGANIGTTCVYFVKKLAPNLKVLAFEPDPETFKLLRANLILNDLDDRTIAVNCGLGDKFDEMTMYIHKENPGGNSLLNYKADAPTETVKVIPLDSYLAENKIAAQDVKYIWIDTEGFEAQVLLGAKNLLAETAAPVFMECNLLAWKDSGLLYKMIDLLKATGYTRFISVLELSTTHKEKIYPIENLAVAAEYAKPPMGQAGDIFLIKNFA